ncbi:MAG TPA: NYN domain-containing protein, partial [Pseudorhodoplanes sp.]|nr:NYN domain-containing protein [Pseudorhodoplanes sp.]
RQADEFIDIVRLQDKIGRDPAERATREGGREPRQHTPQFLQRGAPQRANVGANGDDDEFED